MKFKTKDKKLKQSFRSPHKTVFKEETLNSLLENMTEEERDDTLIIIFVAETELQHVTNVSSLVEEKFPEVVLTSINQL